MAPFSFAKCHLKGWISTLSVKTRRVRFCIPKSRCAHHWPTVLLATYKVWIFVRPSKVCTERTMNHGC